MLFGSRGLRATARITLFFFTWMILYPGLAAATASAPQVPANSASGAPNRLEELRETARRARDQAGKGQAHEAEDQQLVHSEAALAEEESQAEAGFADVEQHIQEHRLPAEIRQRQHQALADYRAKMKALKARLRAFTDARPGPIPSRPQRPRRLPRQGTEDPAPAALRSQPPAVRYP